MEKKQYPLTEKLSELYLILVELGDAKTKIYRLAGSLWNKKIGAEEIVWIGKEYAIAKNRFWCAVYEQYPETKGKNAEADVFAITVKE